MFSDVISLLTLVLGSMMCFIPFVRFSYSMLTCFALVFLFLFFEVVQVVTLIIGMRVRSMRYVVRTWAKTDTSLSGRSM